MSGYQINYKTNIDRISSFILENIDKDNFKKTIQKMEEERFKVILKETNNYIKAKKGRKSF